MNAETIHALRTGNAKIRLPIIHVPMGVGEPRADLAAAVADEDVHGRLQVPACSPLRSLRTSTLRQGLRAVSKAPADTTDVFGTRTTRARRLHP
jgi:NAD(P)H-dependent flavin oxidoreductase YrpB (nitropropane dioxygenase family)